MHVNNLLFILLFMAYALYSFQGKAQLSPILDGVYTWSEHSVVIGKDRETRKITEGSSPHFEYLKIHATTQYPGAKPGKAHANEDMEECIIVKEGTMEVNIEGKIKTLGPGSVILLMPQESHSIKNVGKDNLTYYVMKYKSHKKMNLDRGRASGGSLMLDAEELNFKESSRGAGKPYFDRSTAMCERFEMHITRLDQKGPSHNPHKHTETEIILILSGKTEMTIDGKEYKAEAGDFYFASADKMHGIRNATAEPCMYFAYKWK